MDAVKAEVEIFTSFHFHNLFLLFFWHCYIFMDDTVSFSRGLSGDSDQVAGAPSERVGVLVEKSWVAIVILQPEKN